MSQGDAVRSVHDSVEIQAPLDRLFALSTRV